MTNNDFEDENGVNDDDDNNDDDERDVCIEWTDSWNFDSDENGISKTEERKKRKIYFNEQTIW